jgi:hypothetical protein
MSKLAAVAERLAQTRRWLDQEADRLAARLDQLERRAPAAIQNAHRILDEQQRELDATEQMVAQWLNASAEVAAGANKPRAPQQAGTSPLPRPQARPTADGASAALDPAHLFLDEQQKDVGRLERALQTLATEVPEPQISAVSQPPHAQPKPSSDAAAARDSRRLLDEQQKDEGNLERALQTLANKIQPPQAASAPPPARPWPKQPNEPTPAALDAARRILDEPLKADDATKPAARKLGVVRVA